MDTAGFSGDAGLGGLGLLVALVLAALVAGTAIVAVGVVVFRAALRSQLAQARRDAEVDRASVLRAAQEALAAERHHSVQAAVETVVAVAGEKLADHRVAATGELDMRSAAIGAQFKEVNEELVRMRQLVASMQSERSEQQGRLEQGLAEALRASTSLAQTTQSLREALASTKARGQWGERMADDVLKAAGFVEGVNYRKQRAVDGGGIPDFTFLMPRERVMHMDVKFPLDNYMRSLEAGSDAERASFEAAFLKDVRQRIKEMATRGYSDGEETLEAVLLFIPNESIYGFIHERDPQLADLALGQHVVLCSPFTLFAVLAVIRQAVEAFMVERTSDEILECLASFNGQWQKFSTSLDTLGKRFESSQKAYDDLVGPRKRQLERSLTRIDELRSRRGLAPAARPASDDLVEGELVEEVPLELAAGEHPAGRHTTRLRSIRLK